MLNQKSAGIEGQETPVDQAMNDDQNNLKFMNKNKPTENGHQPK